MIGSPSIAALCNRCNWPHNRKRCGNCGSPEFRLLGGYDAEYEAWVEARRLERLAKQAKKLQGVGT